MRDPGDPSSSSASWSAVGGGRKPFKSFSFRKRINNKQINPQLNLNDCWCSWIESRLYLNPLLSPSSLSSGSVAEDPSYLEDDGRPNCPTFHLLNFVLASNIHIHYYYYYLRPLAHLLSTGFKYYAQRDGLLLLGHIIWGTGTTTTYLVQLIWISTKCSSRDHICKRSAKTLWFHFQVKNYL